MSTLTPEAVERLVKLIKMLSSDRDGEIVNAARLINRTLRDNGADIHVLAARVERGTLSKTDMQRIYDAGRSAGERAGREAAAPIFRDAELTWHKMALEIVIHDRTRGQLNERESEFVEDMVRWTKHREPTEKQAKWLHSIFCKIRRGT